METKMITIPFEVERAKRIQAGEEPGKIVTRDGKDVRIPCWNRKDNTFPIVALVYSEKQLKEFCECYKVNGCYLTSESKYERDLIIQVPEWTQYKDGDVLACEVDCGGGEYYKWYAILKGKIIFYSEGLRFDSYVSYNYDSSYKAGEVEFNDYSDNIDSIRLATDEEKQQLIDTLKQSSASRAKEYLKRFFGIEEKPEYKFEPFDKVLVRMHDGVAWEASLFSHLTNKKHKPFMTVGGIEYEQCIPYSDQTKHLLGTIYDWEAQP